MNYNELSDEAKERAFNDFKNRELYDNHWTHHVLEDWVERLGAIGIDTEVYDIHWSGFHSQGDGASFEGVINLKEFLEAHPDLKARHSGLYVSTIPFDAIRGAACDFYDIVLSRIVGSRYSHEYTIQIGSWEVDILPELDIEYFEGLMMQAEPDILEQCREHMRSLYNDLQNAYEYELGLDNFLESVEYQDFNEDGSLS